MGGLRFRLIFSMTLFVNQSFATSNGDLLEQIGIFFAFVVIICLLVGVFLFIYFENRGEVEPSSASQKSSLLQKADEEKRRRKIMKEIEEEENQHHERMLSFCRDIPNPNLRKRLLDEECEHHKEVENILWWGKESTNQQESKGQTLQIREDIFPLSDKKDVRFERGEKQSLQTKKPITEQGLIEWWNNFGNQRFSECRESIQKRFSNVAISKIKGKKEDPEDWRIISITDTSGVSYILPRKYSEWWTNLMNKESDYEYFFEPEEKLPDATSYIRSLKPPLTNGKYVNGEWTIYTKCKVGFK